jgi:hypothetical protein
MPLYGNEEDVYISRQSWIRQRKNRRSLGRHQVNGSYISFHRPYRIMKRSLAPVLFSFHGLLSKWSLQFHSLSILYSQRYGQRFEYTDSAGMSKMSSVYHRDDASRHLRFQCQHCCIQNTESDDTGIRFECVVGDEVRCGSATPGDRSEVMGGASLNMST